jgi:hypothetical protein
LDAAQSAAADDEQIGFTGGRKQGFERVTLVALGQHFVEPPRRDLAGGPGGDHAQSPALPPRPASGRIP